MCLRCGNSAGEDGFSVKSYQFFFELLGQEFLDSINASYDDQSGYEPLNLENGSFLNSDNFDANGKVKLKLKPLALLRNSAKRNGKKVHEEM